MANLANQIISHLREDYSRLQQPSPPEWLKQSRWTPSLCLFSKEKNVYLAVGIETSGRLPIVVFRKEVVRLLREHKDSLIVLVCVPENGFLDYPETEDLCREMGVGLKVLLPGLGLETVIRTDFDPPQKQMTIPQEIGYFPKVILDRAEGLDKLMFRDRIDEFVKKIRTVTRNEERTRKLVISTINTLLGTHPSFRGHIGQFMQLDHFERLLQLTSPTSSEHIYHSFRVFLAGCPIIHTFYDHFVQAHSFYSASCSEVSVEYAWLLTSIFHDIGRPKEGASALIQEELQDDDIIVYLAGKDSRWQKEGYRNALRILSSLAASLGSRTRSSWDGGGLPDQEGEKFELDWIRIYDQLSSHAVISALDFLRAICEKAKAADERSNRPFVLAHSVPAALAILLHDWKIQRDARKWKLFPINAERFPLAAVLVYLDTWDDYKRKGSHSDIFLKEYELDKHGVHVVIEWSDSTLYENEKRKYKAFEKSLCKQPFQMKITAGMAMQ